MRVRYANLASLISIDTIGVSWIGGREATGTQTDVNVPRKLFFPVTTFATSVPTLPARTSAPKCFLKFNLMVSAN
jgi:hypothetical protein